MARYDRLWRSPVVASVDLVNRMNLASPDQSISAFAGATRSGADLTLSFGRGSTSLAALLGPPSTYWFIPIPEHWDLASPWQETLIDITEITGPNQPYHLYGATTYAGIARTDEGAGIGGAIRWLNSTSDRVGLVMATGVTAQTSTAALSTGRMVRTSIPHMFDGSVPRVDAAITHIYNSARVPIGVSRMPISQATHPSAQGDGSDMRFVVGCGTSTAGSATPAVNVTIRVRAHLIDKRIRGS